MDRRKLPSRLIEKNLPPNRLSLREKERRSNLIFHIKKVACFFLTLFLILFATTALAVQNPAAVYCKKLGYEYKIVKTPAGEKGICVVAPGIEFNAWDFFKGKVGNKYSYGARYGYDTESVRINKGNYFIEYAVCVSRKKLDTEGEKIRIPLLELMKKKGDSLKTAKVCGIRKSKGKEKGDEPHPRLFLAQDASVSRLTDSATVLYGAHSSSHQHPPPSRGRIKKMGKGDFPSSFDWRSKNGHTYIGSIRDQEDCGSCYAFAAAAAAEGTYNWFTENYDTNCADFSESFIIWCLGSLEEYNEHFYGCEGADWDYKELEALTVYGICSETDFPYTTSDPGVCAHWEDPVTIFSSWHRIPCNDTDAIKQAIMTYGVIDTAVLTSFDFETYTDGVYSDSNITCPVDEPGDPCYYTYTNHAVSLVGWGRDETKGDYWILRNSWGTDWGESGYMKIAVTSARVACAPTYLIFRTKGDINSDAVIDISDVILCLRMAIGLPVTIQEETYNSPYPAWLIERADMNGVGGIDISDVILVLRKAIGLDP